jgi:hypothetical protein
MNKIKKEFSNIPFFKNLIINKIQKTTEGKNNQNFKIYTNSGIFF